MWCCVWYCRLAVATHVAGRQAGLGAGPSYGPPSAPPLPPRSRNTTPAAAAAGMGLRLAGVVTGHGNMAGGLIPQVCMLASSGFL